jgi:hypothetical protein
MTAACSPARVVLRSWSSTAEQGPHDVLSEILDLHHRGRIVGSRRSQSVHASNAGGPNAWIGGMTKTLERLDPLCARNHRAVQPSNGTSALLRQPDPCSLSSGCRFYVRVPLLRHDALAHARSRRSERSVEWPCDSESDLAHRRFLQLSCRWSVGHWVRRFTLALRFVHLYGEDLALIDSSVSSAVTAGPVNGAPLCHGRT